MDETKKHNLCKRATRLTLGLIIFTFMVTHRFNYPEFKIIGEYSMDKINSCSNMLATVTESHTNKSPVNENGSLLNGIIEYTDFVGLKTHKQQAILTILTAISAHVGENTTLFLSAQPGVDGLSFMNPISQIIPGSFKREFSELSKPLLLSCPELLKNKVVIALNSETVKKGSQILKILTEQGHVNDQAIKKTGGTTNINEICIEGPASVIVLIGQSESKWLNDFSALRLILESSTNYILERLNKKRMRPDPRQKEILVNVLKKEIERLKVQPVEIPFLDQIVDSLDHTNPDSIMIMDKIISFVNIITIIQNAKLSTEEERKAGYYGLDINHFSKRNDNLLEYQGKVMNAPDQPLVATKKEYFIVYTLIAGALNFNEDQISANAMQVFDAILPININFVFSSTCLDKDKATERDIINTLDNQTDGRGWASLLHIKEEMEKNEGVKTNNSFVSRGVKELLEKKYVSQIKDPNAPNKFLYAITMTTPANRYDLPHPAEIKDPVYKGHSVEVTNPLTGEKEII
ncbi:MAG: hypothetical protein HOJ48_09250 [Desulfobacula sp.]|nr:hypothetical protein [Desulfobacula sp.]